MKLAATQEELRAALDDTPFARAYEVRLAAAGDGECTLLVPYRPALDRRGGIVAGPVFMAVADVAMWLAVLTRLGASDRSVTSQLATTFLSAARGEDFRCTARLLRVGRRLVHGVAECVAGDGRLLTHHTVIYARLGD